MFSAFGGHERLFSLSGLLLYKLLSAYDDQNHSELIINYYNCTDTLKHL